MFKHFLTTIFVAISYLVMGQSLVWQGDTNNFNFSNSIQLNANEAGISIINSSIQIKDSMLWEISIDLNFSPSSNNYTQFYFWKDSISELYIKIGESGTKDGIVLFNEKGLLFELEKSTFSKGGWAKIQLLKRANDFELKTKYHIDSIFKTDSAFTLPSPIQINNCEILCKYTASNTSKFSFGLPYIGPIQKPKPPSFNKNDVIITEIMADPEPAIESLTKEYIEIYNASNTTIPMESWKIIVNENEFIIPNIELQPKQYLSLSNVPTLLNNGAKITLMDPSNNIIHCVAYSIDWHTEAFKRSGGWSLEMDNINYPCLSKNNWRSSQNNKGGSPNAENGIYYLLEDDNSIPIVRKVDSNSIVIHFQTPPDSLFSITVKDLKIDTTLNFGQGEVKIIFTHNFFEETIYWITELEYSNCLGKYNIGKAIGFGIPVDPNPSDILINEILFDPINDQSDFIEFTNSSSKIFNCLDLKLLEIKEGEIEDYAIISNESKLLLPDSLLFVSKNCKETILNYPHSNKHNCIELGKIPGLNNESGTVGIANKSFEIMDELSYSKDWHFPYLGSAEGVSLERISLNNSTADSTNWSSCPGSFFYGTPGRKNANSISYQKKEIPIKLNEFFTPNNNGVNDQLIIEYNLSEANMLGSFFVYSASGVLLKNVKENILLNKHGQLFWNGQINNETVIKTGVYILYVELVNSSKRTVKRHKLTFSVTSDEY